MKKLYFILTLVFILFFLFSLTSIQAVQTLGNIKQYSCVTLPQSGNYTSCLIKSIQYPNKSIEILNYSMAKEGTYFYNDSFCSTKDLGLYIVNTECEGLAYPYDFEVNGSGQDVKDSQISLLIIGIIVLLIMVAFFFILSVMFKHPGSKIFLLSLSALTIIVLIGLIVSNANVYLAEFPEILSIYNSYYILIITLAGTAVLGIVIWLIYYAFTAFNKMRGRTVDDD